MLREDPNLVGKHFETLYVVGGISPERRARLESQFEVGINCLMDFPLAPPIAPREKQVRTHIVRWINSALQELRANKERDAWMLELEDYLVQQRKQRLPRKRKVFPSSTKQYDRVDVQQAIYEQLGDLEETIRFKNWQSIVSWIERMDFQKLICDPDSRRIIERLFCDERVPAMIYEECLFVLCAGSLFDVNWVRKWARNRKRILGKKSSAVLWNCLKYVAWQLSRNGTFDQVGQFRRAIDEIEDDYCLEEVRGRHDSGTQKRCKTFSRQRGEIETILCT